MRDDRARLSYNQRCARLWAQVDTCMASIPQYRPVTVAIDGPSGAGKSTVARLLADRLGLPYLDTGAMYRAIGLLALREELRPPFDEAAQNRLAEIARNAGLQLSIVDGATRVAVGDEDISDVIRTAECGMMASAVSAIPAVRVELVRLQQQLAARAGGVLEGRDIGTVVLPDADLKVFLTASCDERARRRSDDLRARGESVEVEDVRRLQARRDRQDSSRAASPLQVARGSVVVDSTRMSPEEVVERLVHELEERRTAPLDTPGEKPIRSRNHGS